MKKFDILYPHFVQVNEVYYRIVWRVLESLYASSDEDALTAAKGYGYTAPIVAPSGAHNFRPVASRANAATH